MMSKNTMYIWLCLAILFFSCLIFSNKIVEGMYPQSDIDEYKTALSLYRRNGVNRSINNIIKKYHDSGDVKTDDKLKEFFIDCISIKTLDNCSTIKGYPVLFMTILQSIHFLPYNELIERYPKMISDESDYTSIKKIYICAHNMYHEDIIKMPCNKLMKTNCSAQLAPMVKQIHEGIDYFVNKRI